MLEFLAILKQNTEKKLSKYEYTMPQIQIAQFTHTHTSQTWPYFRTNISSNFFFSVDLFCFVSFHSYNFTTTKLELCARVLNIWHKILKMNVSDENNHYLVSRSHKQTDSRFSFFSVVVHSFESYRFYSLWIISLFVMQTHTPRNNYNNNNKFSITWVLQDFLETEIRRPIDFLLFYFVGLCHSRTAAMDKGNFFLEKLHTVI